MIDHNSPEMNKDSLHPQLTTAGDDPYLMARNQMVKEIHAMANDIHCHPPIPISEKVLSIMKSVPRHLFVPDNVRNFAYYNRPLHIGYEQTISQPYIVALMTELLALDSHDRVLEIGTGSGYQTAILAEMAGEVFSMEVNTLLEEQASNLLNELGYNNVKIKNEDGQSGWPENAPFDAIIVTAAASHIPQPLLAQLNFGGRLVIPVDDWPNPQKLMLVTKNQDGRIDEKYILPVLFVPLAGSQ